MVHAFLTRVNQTLHRYQALQHGFMSVRGAVYTQRDTRAPLNVDRQFLISEKGTVVEDHADYAAVTAALATQSNQIVAIYQRFPPALYVRSRPTDNFTALSPIYVRDHLELNSFMLNPVTQRLYYCETTGFYLLSPKEDVV